MRTGGSWVTNRLSFCLFLLLFWSSFSLAQNQDYSDLSKWVYLGRSAAFTPAAVGLVVYPYEVGLQSAFAEANNSTMGGILSKRKIFFESVDDGYVVANSVLNTKNLLAKGVLAIIGQSATANTLAVRDYLDQNKVNGVDIPLVGPHTGALDIYYPFQRSRINVKITYADEVYGMVEYLVNKLYLNRIACVSQNDSFGDSGLAGTIAALSRYGYKLEASGKFDRVLLDMEVPLKAIAGSRPQAIVVFGTGAPAAKFISLCWSKKQMFEGMIFLVPTVASNVMTSLTIPPDQFPTIFISETIPLFTETNFQIARDFVKAVANYDPKFNLDMNAFEGYVLGRFVVSVLERMKESSMTSINNFRKGFLDAVYQSPFTVISGLNIGPFGDDCQNGFFPCCNGGLREVHLSVFQNYTLVPLPGGMIKWTTCGTILSRSQPPIVLGHSTSSGLYGEVSKGLRTAFTEINNKNGINGRPLSVIVYDDASSVNQTLTNILELIRKDNVSIGILAPPPEMSLLTQNITNAQGVPLVAPMGGYPGLRSPFVKGTINLKPSFLDDAASLFHFCSTKGYTKLLVISSSDEAGTFGLSGLQKAINFFNSNSALVVTTTQRKCLQGVVDSPNIDSDLTQTEVVLFLGRGVASCVASIKKKSPKNDLVLSSYVNADEVDSETAKASTTSAGIIYTTWLPFNRTAYQFFVSAWSNSQQNRPTWLGFEGYMVGSFMSSLMSRINGQITTSSFTRAIYDLSVIEVMEETYGPFVDCSTDPTCGCNQGARKMTFLILGSGGMNTSREHPSMPPFKWSTCGVVYPEEPKVIKAGFVYDGQIVDLAETFSYDQARVKVFERMQSNLQTEFAQGKNTTNGVLESVREWISRNFTVFFLTSSLHEEAALILSNENPGVQFILVGGTGIYTGNAGGSNLKYLVGNIHQARFLSGVFAGSFSKSRKIGFVLQQKNAQTANNLNSFFLGMNAVTTDFKIYTTYINESNFPTKITQLHQGAVSSLISKGVDIVVSMVNRDIIPRFVSQQKQLLGSIGWQNDIRIFVGESVLTSVYLNFANDFEQIISSLLVDKPLPKLMYSNIGGGAPTLAFFSNLVPVIVQSIVLESRAELIKNTSLIYCGPLWSVNSGQMMVNSSQCLNDTEIQMVNSLLVDRIVTSSTSPFEDLGFYEVPPPVIDYVDISEGISIAFVVVSAILMALAAMVAFWIFVHRDKPVIRATTVEFTFIILLGIFTGFSSVIPWWFKPTDKSCRVRPWLITLALDLLSYPLYIKTWRLLVIFRSSLNRKEAGAISNLKMFFIMCFFLSIDLIILIVWSATDPLYPVINNDNILLCTSDRLWVWLGLLIGTQGAWAICGATLAFMIRNLPSKFNESKPIIISIYNSVLISVVVIPVLTVFTTSPKGFSIFISIALWLIFLIPMIALLVNKLLHISDNGTGGSTAGSTKGTVTSGTSNN